MTHRPSPFEDIISIGEGRLKETMDSINNEYIANRVPVGHVAIPPRERKAMWSWMSTPDKMQVWQQLTPEQRAKLGGA